VPARVVAGRLTGVFGIRGELKCIPTAGPETFAAGRRYTFATRVGSGEVFCTAVRRHHTRLLLAFEGIDTPESARALVGAELFVERTAETLESGEFLDADLIGAAVCDEAGIELARVVGVRHLPAGDYLVVDPGEALVPLVRAFVRDIDLDARRIVMALPQGLLEP